MKRTSQRFRINKRLAEQSWGRLTNRLINSLKSLTSDYGLSVGRGDLICLDGRWYITHSGLLRLASRRRCVGIQVEMVHDFCDPASARWAFRATVFPSEKSTGFVGFGDADPSNISSLVQGAELRVAETRAVNRALRKAYGIGICSVEEIGSFAEPQPPQKSKKVPPQPVNGNYGGSKIRDRLCQIIRQHQLDATLVKSYATDFCGVKSLREATREQVENFVVHLSDWAEKGRDSLLCQLNSYAVNKEMEGVA
jgi:hypothetical protein